MNVNKFFKTVCGHPHRTVLFLIGLFMSAALYAQTQRFTGTFKDTKLQTVLSTIQNKSKVKFVYNASIITSRQRITATAKEEAVDNFLNRILQPYQLEVVWSNGVGVIRKIGKQSNIRITGIVRDGYGEPLVGASVLIVGGQFGVTTDQNGKYMLHAHTNDVLQVSYVGYETKEIAVDNRNSINITLHEQVNEIAEYVHTGYQSVERNKLTSAVTTLKMDDIKVEGINTIDGMLEGRVPGMIFMKNSGQVGAAPKLRIRGTSTIIGTREPLWVLDGIVLNDPVNVDTESLNDPDFVNLLGNAIAGLNPNDIEQIDVLKDASATALYGSKAGNGVIVITTKKGKIGRPSISYQGSVTYSPRQRYSDQSVYMMTSAERMDVSKELIDRKMYYSEVSQWSGYEDALQKYYSGIIGYDEFKRLSDYYASKNTDWFDLLMRDAISHNHAASISGGSQNIRYYASLGYTNERGVIKGDNLDRYTAAVNVTTRYKKFGCQFSINANTSSHDYLPSSLGVMDYAYNMSRTTPAYNEDGTLFYYPRRASIASNVAPYQYNILNEIANCGSNTQNDAITMQSQIRYDVLPYLNLQATLAYGITNSNTETYYTKDTYYVAQLRADQTLRNDMCPVGGEMQKSYSRTHNYTARLQANFIKTLGKRHLINASAGIEAISNENKNYSITRRGYFTEFGGYYDYVPTDYTGYYSMWMQNKAALGTNSRLLNNQLAWYVTGGYSWNDIYTFNVHMRHEQSNVFGTRANDEFMPIWALSGKWNIKRDILKKVDWVNELDMRGSYGWQGNMLTGQTARMILRQIGITNQYYDQMYATISNYPNPDLKWEKTASSNLGLDFSLFNNKVRGSVAYYYKKTKDAFLNKTISEINGITTYVVNSGTLTNQGFELSLSFTPINQATTASGGKRGFVWRIDPQIGEVINKLVNKAITNTNVIRDNIKYTDYLNGSVETSGNALSTFYSYRYKGLSNKNGAPEFYGFEDDNELKERYKNMTREEILAEILEESGQREPYIQGGISNYFGYRNWGLSFNLTYSLGNKVRLLKMASGYATACAYPQQNLRKEFVYRWRKPGDEQFTNIPALVTDAQANQGWWQQYPYTTTPFAGDIYEMYDNSNLRVVSGNYLKMQSLSLRYNLEDKLCQQLGLQSLYLCLSGTNLFTICSSKLKGQDPSISGSSSVINLGVRPTYSFSLNITI